MVLRVRSKKERERDTTNEVGHPEEARTGPVSIPNQRNGRWAYVNRGVEAQ
jgi:hypothetical protein